MACLRQLALSAIFVAALFQPAAAGAFVSSANPFGERDFGDQEECDLGRPDNLRREWLFTGKELDWDTGLMYFGARYYDPRTALWQSPDPILDEYMRGHTNEGVYSPANLGLYSYSWNSPVVLRDPDGQWVHLAAAAFNRIANSGPGQWLARNAVRGVQLAGRGVVSLYRYGVQAGQNVYNRAYQQAAQKIEIIQELNQLGQAPGVNVTVRPVAPAGQGATPATRGVPRDLHAEAVAARDAFAAELATQRHPPATVVGGYSPSSGTVTAGASRGRGLGCAEGVCSEALGHPPDIQFTPAVRPRTGQPVDVCPNCESTYGRGAFPDPATRFRTDRGGQ